jgi:RHS repeat-associated protein
LDQLASQTTPPSQTNPAGDTTSYTYDADGRPYTEKDPQGRTTTATYNPVGQPAATTYSDGETGETYTYYPSGTQTGLLEKTTDASGTTSYTYDLDGRTSSVTNGAGLVLSYAYNPDSELSSLTYPGNVTDTVTYAYNNMDQESSLKDWLGNTTSFGYDSAGRLSTVSLPNGVTESTTYDKDSQVSSITDTLGGSTLASFNYATPARNADEEVMSETDAGTPGPSAQSYTYDALHRVTSDNSSSYGYNAQSQLTTGPSGATQALYPAGELCWSMTSPPPGSTCSATPAGATAYTFNQEGQRTQTTTPTASSTYAWNEHGQLTSTTTGASTVGYTYNAAGLLSTRSQAGNTANFAWDPVESTNPLLVDDGTNYYIYGPDALPTEQIGASSGTVDYYLHDQLGSTRLLTTASGSVAGSWTYDAWGNTVASTGGSGGGGGTTTTTTAPTTTTSGSSTTTTRATTTTTGATTTTTAATTTTTAPTTTTTTTAGGGTISTVGALAYAHGSATTLSVSPKAVGDLMTLVVSVVGGPVSSVSGGGVTTWYKDIAKVGNQEGNDNEIWWGVVSTTGASTITVAFTGSHSADELMAQEYSAGSGATWSTGANGSTSSTTSTVTFPSLTPSGAGELYLGFAQVDGTGEAGTTSGFNYTITSAEGSVLCWDTNVSATTSPTATQTGTGSDSVGALFAASGGGGGTTTTTAPTTTTTTAPTTTTSSSTTTTGATTTTTGATTTTTGATTTTTAPTTTTTAAGGGTISTVGTLAYAHGSATTLSVSPQAVGDLMVFVVNVDGGPVSSVSGGGVTTWNKDIAKVGTEEGNDNEIWWGVVSASGASTITVSFTGSHSDDELMAQEYSAGAGATWSTGANGSTSSTTSTVTFPSLTPTGAGELYLGFAQVDGGGEAGSTPGFSYTITSAEASVLCWDTNVSTTTSPTATQTATGSDSVGALFAASGGTGGTTTTTAATTTTTGATTTTVPTGTTTTTVPSSTTTTSVSGSGATTPLLWAGQYQDPTTGLYYMRARWYDPATGEFLSSDPDFSQTLDAYGYGDENPLDNVDPSGLRVATDPGAAGELEAKCAADPKSCETSTTPTKKTTPTTKTSPTTTTTTTSPAQAKAQAQALATLENPIPTVTTWAAKMTDAQFTQAYTALLDTAFGAPTTPKGSPCSGVAPDGSAGPVDQWNPVISCVLTTLIGVPSGDLQEDISDVDIMITNESSGQPGVINNWDVNATVNGTPSVGLMQVILPTFETLTNNKIGQELSHNPLNSVANLYAGISCAMEASGGDLDKLYGIERVHAGKSYVGYGCNQ